MRLRSLIISIATFAVCTGTLHAQDATQSRLCQGMMLDVESTTTMGGGKYAPLWLSSNRYGLSSVNTKWNYERVALHRDMNADVQRKWRLGYGMDIAVMFGGEQTFCLQELYLEAAWKKIQIMIGSKQQPLQLKNAMLSSGGLSYGINARPIPQIRLGVDYFSIPYTNDWWQWRGHVSYGMKNDGRWQKNYVDDHGYLGQPIFEAHRTEGTLYHEKSLYWKVGNTRYFPLELEAGLQWAAEFGGTSYSFRGRNFSYGSTVNGVKLPTGIKALWNVFIIGGNDITDGDISNTEGNHLGSWNIALTYNQCGWKVRAYAERYFEDISQLGVTYGISDHLLGLEIELPSNPVLSSIVVENINTREQSGAVYHDYTTNIPDKMNGRDDYYNHNIYTGWQNFGMSMGNPLITSPLYNESLHHDGSISFLNNRIYAWHIALAGHPAKMLTWRAMVTWTRNWGTYANPLPDPQEQIYAMAEAGIAPRQWKGWGAKAAIGIDHGKLLGNNTGVQLTITKQFQL